MTDLFQTWLATHAFFVYPQYFLVLKEKSSYAAKHGEYEGKRFSNFGLERERVTKDTGPKTREVYRYVLEAALFPNNNNDKNEECV